MNLKLEKFKQELKGKRIAVIGAGVSNLPLLVFLCQMDCDVSLFDRKTLEEMDEKTKSTLKELSVSLFLGEDYLEHLAFFDVIFRSPSFLPTNPLLVKEKERGALVTTEIEQVIRLTPSRVIGVTGSKGKTTTTTIVHHILTNLGYHTYLGGNIGVPLFDKLDEMKESDIVVLELSSFQLMNMEVSPDIAVVTNISPDHLDIHGSYLEYIEAKKNIFNHQKDTDCLVLNEDDPIVSQFFKEAIGRVKYFGERKYEDCYILNGDFIQYNGESVIDTRKLKLRGKHNYLNLCAALNAICPYINVTYETLERIACDIPCVAHRLEFVREIDGVKWYNDSASTTPDKSIAGILAFKERLVLIAGGYDKNIAYDSIAAPILEHVSQLILFGATKDKIYQAVMQLSKETGKTIPIYMLDSLEEVVRVAEEVSEPGEVVLFSPASASFDMFKNAYQRGDQFKELVKNL